jgi:hypothetical protein
VLIDLLDRQRSQDTERDGLAPPAYMWNVDLAPGRSVPNGTEVEEPGSIGVAMDQFREVIGPDGNGYLAGHTDFISSATNWDVYTHDYTIIYYCTNNTALAEPDDNGVL